MCSFHLEHKNHGKTLVPNMFESQIRVKNCRVRAPLTGIVNATDIYDNIQVFQNFLVPGPDDLGVLETLCFLEHKTTQRFIAMKGAVVRADLYHLPFISGAARGAEGHHTDTDMWSREGIRG